jgi:uncharacterized integral membrane protein
LGFVRFLQYVVASVLLIGIIVFAVSNRDPVRLKLFPFPFLLETPVYLALIAALAMGVVVGVVTSYVLKLRVQLSLRSLLHRSKVTVEPSRSSKNTRKTSHSPES